ncbi:DUF998 domain-containing protein [Amycolatopsis sp. CA-128772]|uniref:DUF998 domain-containing protein n=1 Tax=Amycolatopsis sp. CA-128772 TaxID=2073159 RepID=UPI001E5C9792|nr:DUF998 domain-containing protein [Amycolatopsis sp. CA-128772]
MIPRTALAPTLTLVTAALAQAIITGLTFGFAGNVSPWRDPVSDYAWHRGGRPLFTLALLLLLASAATLAIAAQLAALPRSPLMSTLFLLWTAGITVVLVFRSNVSAAEPTVSGEIHRAGGAVLFASPPLAAWTLSTRLHVESRWVTAAPALRRGAIAGVATAAGFSAAQVITWLPAGLLERAALLAEFFIVTTIAVALRRAARAVHPPTTTEPAVVARAEAVAAESGRGVR